MAFRIVEYKEYRNVMFYSLQFDGEDENMTDQVLSKYYSDYPEDIRKIVSAIAHIGRMGAWERFFRPEKRGRAIPKEQCNLRLYCIRCHNGTVILDGGGVKTAATAQESPDVANEFAFINNLDEEFVRRIMEREIAYEEDVYLIGNLNFDNDEQDI